jgi:hypothetical protein
MVNFSRKQQKIDVVFTLAPPILISKRSRVAQTNDDEGEKGTTGGEKKRKRRKFEDRSDFVFSKVQSLRREYTRVLFTDSF